MKNTLFLALFFIALTSCTQKKENGTDSKTQAFLGVKEGGEWVWVTKDNGNAQFEYHGGEFKPVEKLKVAEQHTDHSFDIQYEGPGWESDKIGYRLYLDWRNAIDIFGKKVDTLVLHKVGLDGFDSYHEVSGWGVDVLKVGSSLGIGSLAFWDGDKAIRVEKTDSMICQVANRKNSSEVFVDYFGWEINGIKTDLHSVLKISDGSYLTRYHIELSESLPNIASGIVILPNTQTQHIEDITAGWNCLITFGVQTLQDDILGMALFYPKSQLIELAEDENSHVVVMKPDGKELTYFFGAAWQQDASGITKIDDFIDLMKDQTRFIK